MPDPLLSVRDLRTYFYTEGGVAKSVDGVSFDIGAAETVGLVGESGCGKSVTALSLMRLVRPPGRIEPGSKMEFGGEDLTTISEKAMRAIRGERIAMVFQEKIVGPYGKVGSSNPGTHTPRVAMASDCSQEQHPRFATLVTSLSSVSA